jgi:O-acetylhomoserine/O-acetylserine sulfhydrylase-like pyridoxal-dependent enzyme
LTINPQKGGKMLKPTTPHVLTMIEFDSFSTTIENLETPLGHFLAMEKHIRKNNFGNLKSHDYHILMQQILPLTLRGCLAFSPTSNECKKNYFLQISTLLMHFKLRFT